MIKEIDRYFNKIYMLNLHDIGMLCKYTGNLYRYSLKISIIFVPCQGQLNRCLKILVKALRSDQSHLDELMSGLTACILHLLMNEERISQKLMN